jgi:hypothetical protein
MAANEAKIEISAVDKTAQAFSSVSSRLLGIEQSFSKVGAMIGGLSVAAAVGFVGNSVKQAADFADEMGKAAQKVGTTTEALSGLKYAADLSDVSFEQLQTGMGKLAKTSEDFRDGSKSAADAFAKIKLDPTQFKDTSDLFSAVAEKLSKMDDGARKTAIAQELLGKSGKELIPLLNGGAAGLKQMADEAERLGVIVTEDAAKGAEKFNDNITRIETAAKGASIQLGGPLVKSLADTTEGMIKSIAEGNRLFALLQGFAGLGKLPFDMLFSSDIDVSSKSKVKQLNNDVIDLEQSIRKLNQSGGGKLNELVAGGTVSELEAKLKITKNQLEAYKKLGEQLDKKPTTDKKSAGDTIGAITSTAKKESGKSEAEKYAEDMAKLLKTFDDAAQPAQTLSEKLQAQLDSYAKLDPAVKTYLVGIVAQTKATEDAAKAAESLAESNQRINDMMESTQTYDDNAQAIYDANAESYNAILRETEDINASLIENDKERAKAQLEIEYARILARIDSIEGEEDQITAIREAAAERNAAALAAIEKMGDKNKELGRELGLTFSSAFEDSIVKGKEFSEVLKGIGEDLIRIMARKTVTEPLADMFSGIGSGVGDWFKGLSFNANGNVYQGAGISQYSGSVVSQPTMFASGGNVMGEAGPEGIFPLKRGKDGKLGVSAEGSASNKNTFNVSVNVDATGGNVAGDSNRATELGRQIEGAVRAVLLKEKRQGGVLA